MNLRTTEKEPTVFHLVLILDASSSMEAKKDLVINSTNEHLDDQRSKLKDSIIKVTMTVFSSHDKVNILSLDEDITNVANLTKDTYVPKGLTAMYDAVGITIGKVKNQSHGEKDKYLVLIITDGDENDSKEFNNKSVSDIIKECKKDDNWTFAYVGTTKDLSEVMPEIPKGNYYIYNGTQQDTGQMFRMSYGSAANYTASVIGGQSVLEASTNFFNQEMTPDFNIKPDTIIGTDNHPELPTC